MSDRRDFGKFLVDMYGLPGNKWIACHEKSRRPEDRFYAKVNADFSLADIETWERIYTESGGHTNYMIGYKLKLSDCSFDITGHCDLPYEYLGLYPLFELMIKTAEELGHDIDVYTPKLDTELTDIMKSINSDVIEQKNMLKLLEGSGVLSLLKDLNKTKTELIESVKVNKTHVEEITELKNQNEKLKEEVHLHESTMIESQKALEDLVIERQNFKKETIEKLRTAISSL